MVVLARLHHLLHDHLVVLQRLLALRDLILDMLLGSYQLRLCDTRTSRRSLRNHLPLEWTLRILSLVSLLHVLLLLLPVAHLVIVLICSSLPLWPTKLLLLAAYSECIPDLVPDLVVLEHQLLLRVVHEQILILLSVARLHSAHGILLTVQRQWHGVSELVAGHLHYGGVASTDHRATICCVVVRC